MVSTRSWSGVRTPSSQAGAMESACNLHRGSVGRQSPAVNRWQEELIYWQSMTPTRSAAVRGTWSSCPHQPRPEPPSWWRKCSILQVRELVRLLAMAGSPCHYCRAVLTRSWSGVRTPSSQAGATESACNLHRGSVGRQSPAVNRWQEKLTYWQSMTPTRSAPVQGTSLTSQQHTPELQSPVRRMCWILQVRESVRLLAMAASNCTYTSAIYTLSLHDALPISSQAGATESACNLHRGSVGRQSHAVNRWQEKLTYWQSMTPTRSAPVQGTSL